MEIDIVYLWVDGSDPAWRARHNAAVGKTEDDSAVNCDGRFADNDELRYSLRSVELYAPWIRNIFIVTDRQVPRWLDTSNPKVKIVDHTEILPEEYLPTFNSCVLEHSLYKIPGLADHFLYANDDTFINRPVKPSDFFTPEGFPIVRLNRRPFRRLTLWFKNKIAGKPLSNYNRTIHNSAMLVKSHYGKYPGGKPHHNIDAYCRKDYEQTFETFRETIQPTLYNHVRGFDDIQRILYSYVPLMEKRAGRQYVSRSTSFHFHIDNPTHYSKLEKAKPMLFCLNDSQYATDEDRRRVTAFLESRFPTPSSFELQH